jgi:hypothetical protein
MNMRLSDELLRKMNAYWRAANYLSVGQLYLYDNPLLKKPLTLVRHQKLLDLQRLPPGATGKGIWKHRFDEINYFEKYLVRNGIVVLKFFLNLSKGEQKRRLLARINTPEKSWKFSLADVKERAYWDDYMNAFEDVFNLTGTEHAPWYIIFADNKWFTRTVVADVIVEKLRSLKLSYPVVSEEHRQHLLEGKELLKNEPS